MAAVLPFAKRLRLFLHFPSYVRIQAGGFQLIIFHQLFRQRLCINQLSPRPYGIAFHHCPVIVRRNLQQSQFLCYWVGVFVERIAGVIPVIIRYHRPFALRQLRHFVNIVVGGQEPLKFFFRRQDTTAGRIAIIIAFSFRHNREMPDYEGGLRLRVMGQCKAPAILKDGLLLDLIPF